MGSSNGYSSPKTSSSSSSSKTSSYESSKVSPVSSKASSYESSKSSSYDSSKTSSARSNSNRKSKTSGKSELNKIQNLMNKYFEVSQEIEETEADLEALKEKREEIKKQILECPNADKFFEMMGLTNQKKNPKR